MASFIRRDYIVRFFHIDMYIDISIDFILSSILLYNSVI